MHRAALLFFSPSSTFCKRGEMKVALWVNAGQNASSYAFMLQSLCLHLGAAVQRFCAENARSENIGRNHVAASNDRMQTHAQCFLHISSATLEWRRIENPCLTLFESTKAIRRVRLCALDCEMFELLKDVQIPEFRSTFRRQSFASERRWLRESDPVFVNSQGHFQGCA